MLLIKRLKSDGHCPWHHHDRSNSVARLHATAEPQKRLTWWCTDGFASGRCHGMAPVSAWHATSPPSVTPMTNRCNGEPAPPQLGGLKTVKGTPTQCLTGGP
jgi:hypothetical protein